MRPYTPDTRKGRTVARDDIHHATQDKHGNASREPSAKAMRHAARQEGQRQARQSADPRMCADCDEQLEPTQMVCPFCDEPTRTVDDVMRARWERQQEDYASEPPMSAQDRHEAAWQQKQELRR